MTINLKAIIDACRCPEGRCTDRDCQTRARLIAGTFGHVPGHARVCDANTLTVAEWRARQTEAAA